MKENVKKFFEELENNDKALEFLKAASADGAEPDIAALARVARETGYDVSDEEMRACMEELRKLRAAASDAVAEKLGELEPDEMEVGAGGGENKACHDTYKEGENCAIFDACNKFAVLYPSDHGDNICESNTYCEKTLTKSTCLVGKVSFCEWFF